jgi:hypothetical protein
MHDARFGSFSAMERAGNHAHAAGSTMAGAAVVGNIYAALECRIEQKFPSPRIKLSPVHDDLVVRRSVVAAGFLHRPPRFYQRLEPQIADKTEK